MSSPKLYVVVTPAPSVREARPDEIEHGTPFRALWALNPKHAQKIAMRRMAPIDSRGERLIPDAPGRPDNFISPPLPRANRRGRR